MPQSVNVFSLKTPGWKEVGSNVTREELDPHDAEDQPEHHAHKEHIDDGRDGPHQGVHHNLSTVKLLHQGKSPDHPQYEPEQYVQEGQVQNNISNGQ